MVNYLGLNYDLAWIILTLFKDMSLIYMFRKLESLQQERQ